MVTTNSLSPDLDFTVKELLSSSILEDQEVAQQTIACVGEVVQKLLPILVYVGSWFGTIRGIGFDNDRILLDEKGQWHRQGVNFEHKPDDEAWHSHPVSLVLERLENLLNQASRKRQEHLAAVDKRKELLNSIGALIRENAAANLAVTEKANRT